MSHDAMPSVGSRIITLILTPQAMSQLEESHWQPDSRFGISELDKILEKYQCKSIRYLLSEKYPTQLKPENSLRRTFVLLFEPGIIMNDVRQELLAMPDIERAADGYFLKRSSR